MSTIKTSDEQITISSFLHLSFLVNAFLTCLPSLLLQFKIPATLDFGIRIETQHSGKALQRILLQRSTWSATWAKHRTSKQLQPH